MSACYSEILGVHWDFFLLGKTHARKLPEAIEIEIFFFSNYIMDPIFTT